jgi:HSP20 family protein
MSAWNVADVDTGFGQFQKEIDQILNSCLHGGVAADAPSSAWLPKVDIVEQEQEFRVTLELPGVKKEDVKITVADDVLTVKGEKKEEEATQGKQYQRSERRYGSFQRSFVLPALVKSDRIEASYDSGVLSITLPKMEEAKPKEIEVKVK